MKRKITLFLCPLCVLTVLVTSLMLTGVFTAANNNSKLQSLEQRAELISISIDTAGVPDGSTAPYSGIAVIDSVGKTEYSSISDPEILSAAVKSDAVSTAKAGKTGITRSIGGFMTSKTAVAAVALSGGRILLVTAGLDTLLSPLLSHWYWLVTLLAIAAAVSLAVSRALAGRICAPINALSVENADSSRCFHELEPLCSKLRTQNALTEKRISTLETSHEKHDKARREFTANVSHELKTPLTSVSGYAELIRDGIAKGEDASRFGGKIYDEAQRMITLVGDIIKLSQFDEKDINIKIESIDLYECCRAVITGLEAAAQRTGVEISLTGDRVSINGAELIVEEMIHNLLDNAVKYNVPGGRVDVRLRQCIDGVELSVSDTGIGIPKEDISHIFERFYRVDKSHSKEIGGTGLGLSIVKHGAMFHNASVSVESEPGRGTTVRILF